MIYEVFITPQALFDMQSIYNYIAYHLKSSINAKAQLSRIEEMAKKLEYMPNRHPVYKNDIRFVPVNNYVIYYRVVSEKTQVQILRVLYSSLNEKGSLV